MLAKPTLYFPLIDGRFDSDGSTAATRRIRNTDQPAASHSDVSSDELSREGTERCPPIGQRAYAFWPLCGAPWLGQAQQPLWLRKRRCLVHLLPGLTFPKSKT